MSHPLLNFATKIAIPLKTPSTAKSPWPPFSLRDPSSFDSPPFAAVDLRATGNGCFHHQQTIWNIYKAKKNYIDLYWTFWPIQIHALYIPGISKKIYHPAPPPHPPPKKKTYIWQSHQGIVHEPGGGILKTLGGEAASNFVPLQKTTCLCWVIGCFNPKTHCLVHMDTKFTAHHNPSQKCEHELWYKEFFFWHTAVSNHPNNQVMVNWWFRLFFWDSRDTPK